MEFNFWIFTFEENSDLELCFNEISYQVIQILDWVIFPDFQHSVFCQKNCPENRKNVQNLCFWMIIE